MSDTWICGHVAGAACAECYRVLAAKAAELQAEVDAARDRAAGAIAFTVRDDLRGLARVMRALASHARAVGERAETVGAVNWYVTAQRLDIAAQALERIKHGRGDAHQGQAQRGPV